MAYQDFITTRIELINNQDLQNALRIELNDDSIGIAAIPPHYRIKKVTDWTPEQISLVQNILNTIPASTPQREAQQRIDEWPIEMRAFAFAVIDQINILRQRAGLSAATPEQVIAAIRNKADTLS